MLRCLCSFVGSRVTRRPATRTSRSHSGRRCGIPEARPTAAVLPQRDPPMKAATLAAAAAALLLLAPTGPAEQPAQPPAALIVVHAKVVTVHAKFSIAEPVAVHSGK